MNHLLTALIVLPLVGAVVTYFAGESCEKRGADIARWSALASTMAVFLLSLLLLVHFRPDATGFQFVQKAPWFVGYNIFYELGIDGISLWLILLTTFLMPICILCSWDSIKTRVPEFMALFLVLESLVIGTFCALDLLLFYLFFEAVLIPMYLIIGIWGGKNRILRGI